MTGLPNRRGWDRTTKRLRPQIEAGGPFALGNSDINGFGEVNKDSGHDWGDIVLRILAHVATKRIRQDSKNSHTDLAATSAARPGGDELWWLFDMRPPSRPLGRRRGGVQSFSYEEMQASTERIKDRVQDAFVDEVNRYSDLRPYNLTLAMGIVVAREDVTIEQLLSEADAAAYEDKLTQLEPKLDENGVATLHDISAAMDGLGVTGHNLRHFFALHNVPDPGQTP